MKTVKVVAYLLVFMAINFFAGEKAVYASEFSDEVTVVEEIELTEEQMQLLIQEMQKNGELGKEESVKEYVYVTDEAPDNVMSILSRRSGSNGYTIEPYEGSYLSYTKWLGKTIDVLTINVTGEIYVYEDGKIHLYSMRIEVIKHVSCDMDIDIELDIRNTDGSSSMGKGYVYIDSQPFGERCFSCMVFVTNAELSGSDSYGLSVSIGQAW